MSKQYIPIKSLRSFQRYMGKPGVQFQMNSVDNMNGTVQYPDSYTTERGGWLDCDDIWARKIVTGRVSTGRLNVRAVREVREGEPA